jgi:hypothetical protein
MAAINIARHTFHGEWNYTTSQRPPKTEPYYRRFLNAGKIPSTLRSRPRR